MTEPVGLDRRLDRLARIEGQVERARESFEWIRTPRTLRIRTEFAMRSDPAEPNGDLADRLLPRRNERPPATRLVSPRGIALRLYLTALFVAQSRLPGAVPGNKLPLADTDAAVSWIDLIATSSERHRGRVYSSQREKKLRQVHDALRRLSSPEVQLVGLPNFQRAPTGKYEGFLLMHEGGAPAGGEGNELYTVPSAESKTMYLPRDLFLNGWIHVLEDSELAFILMLACLRSRFDKVLVFATSEVRLLQFGLGRDAYEAHRLLSRLGLVRVLKGPHPGRRLGRTGRYLKSDPPKLHRFELLNEGFGKPAILTTRQVVTRLCHQAQREPQNEIDGQPVGLAKLLNDRGLRLPRIMVPCLMAVLRPAWPMTASGGSARPGPAVYVRLNAACASARSASAARVGVPPTGRDLR